MAGTLGCALTADRVDVDAHGLEESKINAFNKTALEWWRSDPSVEIVVIRQCIEPLTRLMEKLFEMDSTQHEKQRRADVTLQLLSGGNAGFESVKSLPLVVAASCRLEQTCLQEISLLLMTDNLWCNVIQRKWWTSKNRTLAYRVLARCACSVEASFGMRHKCCPLRLSRLLLDPDVTSQGIGSLKECELCPWSADFIHRHTGQEGGITSKEALGELKLICMLGRLSQRRIEQLHSQFRRRSLVRGVQSHAPTFPGLAAEFVCDRARVRKHPFQSYSETNDASGKSNANANPAEKTTCNNRIANYGGPWRAFIREQTLQTSGDAQ